MLGDVTIATALFGIIKNIENMNTAIIPHFTIDLHKSNKFWWGAIYVAKVELQMITAPRLKNS